MRGGFAGRAGSLTQNGRLLIASGALQSLAAHINEGRLTATTALPVTTADVSGATSIYFTPFVGDKIALYDGAIWNVRTFTELTLSLAAYTASKPYDIFAYDVAGVVTLESLVWTSATARATALVRQNGVPSRASVAAITSISVANPTVVTTTTPHGYVTGTQVVIAGTATTPTTVGTWTATVTGASTFTIPVNVTVGAGAAGTVTAIGSGRRYLGTIYINSSGGQTDDAAAKRNLFNYNNRVLRQLLRIDPTGTWGYNSGTIRQANGATANQIEVMVGMAEDAVSLGLSVTASGTLGEFPQVYIGLDSTTAAATGSTMAGVRFSTTNAHATRADYVGYPAAGYHTLTWLESRSGANTVTFSGTNGGADTSGLFGLWKA